MSFSNCYKKPYHSLNYYTLFVFTCMCVCVLFDKKNIYIYISLFDLFHFFYKPYRKVVLWNLHLYRLKYCVCENIHGSQLIWETSMPSRSYKNTRHHQPSYFIVKIKKIHSLLYVSDSPPRVTMLLQIGLTKVANEQINRSYRKFCIPIFETYRNIRCNSKFEHFECWKFSNSSTIRCFTTLLVTLMAVNLLKILQINSSDASVHYCVPRIVCVT